MALQIEEFRFDDRPWRLDWIGSVHFHGSSQTEPRIAAYLSQLKPGHAEPLSNKSLAEPYKHRVAAIKVGQIPLLQIGSVWVDGIPCLTQSHKELDLVLHHSQFDLIRFDQHVDICSEVTQPLLTAHQYRVGGAASREASGSWLAVAFDPIPGLRFVAIPSCVLFQKCIATSPKAIRRLVYGQLDKIVDPACGFYVDRPDTFYVNLFKDFRDSEAPALANLLADPVARREYKRFRHALVVGSANFDRSRPGSHLETHIKLGLPFSNPVEMKVRGKYLRYKSPAGYPVDKLWGFLVTSIVDLQPSLVFTRLVVGRKNSGKQGANSGDPDLRFAFGPTVKEPTAPTEPVQPITSAHDPAANLEKLSLEACGGLNPIGLTMVTEPKAVQSFQAWPIVPQDGDEFDGAGTTGDLHGTTSGLAEVDLELDTPPRVPVTLEHFLETLELLAARDVHFETLIVSNAHRRVADHAVNYLPRKINKVRSWHLTSDDPRAVPRGYVVAEIKRGDVWHYLVELERKGGEALALAHINHLAGEQIEPRRLEWFMVDVAKANGWNAIEDYKHWVYRPIRHTPSKGAQAFANAIAARL